MYKYSVKTYFKYNLSTTFSRYFKISISQAIIENAKLLKLYYVEKINKDNELFLSLFTLKKNIFY